MFKREPNINVLCLNESQISTCFVKRKSNINVLCLNMSQISTCCVQTNKIFQLQLELANTLWIFANKDSYFLLIHQKTIKINIENYALPGKLVLKNQNTYPLKKKKKTLNCFSWDLSLFKIIIILKSSVNLKIKKMKYAFDKYLRQFKKRLIKRFL